MRSFVECRTPYCSNCFFIVVEDEEDLNYVFCRECRKEHSSYVLNTQVDHEKPIKDIIMDARLFNSANNMADYIGVSFVTVYHWIKKYFGVSFQEFRRDYICRSERCYLVNIKGAPYSRPDYILKKVKDKRYCACINELGKDYMMTNAPIKLVSKILNKTIYNKTILYKKSEKVDPIYFWKPIYFEGVLYKIDVKPIYFDIT